MIYLAPIRGVTDHIYRTLFERHFGTFDFLVTPFITTVKGKDISARHVRDISGEHNDRLRCIPQIIGNDPDDFVRCVGHMHVLGYSTVNWNLGCPHPQITRKQRGCGLLPFPERIDRFLASVLSRIPCTLSVKVRLGLDNEYELERLMEIFNNYPLQEVIVHPRTGKQMYAGSVNSERFLAAAALCNHRVVYNGDIDTLDIFHQGERQFAQINRWMIGRGMVRNPFLLQSIREDRTVERDYVVLRQFHDAVFQANSRILYGPAHLLGKMKELWFYFCHNFDNGKKLLKTIQRCTTIDRYLQTVDRLFSQKKGPGFFPGP